MILIDTSSWIDFFAGNKRSAGTVDEILSTNQAAICGPILTEIYRGLSSEKQIRLVIPLFEGCHQLKQPERLWEEAGVLGARLLKSKMRIKTLDLLIACYALAHQVSLLTQDSDFRAIRSLGVPLVLVD